MTQVLIDQHKAELPVLPDTYGSVEEQIVERYRVSKTQGGFWPSCVKAGDGNMDVFVGSTKQAENVRQALRTACLDGAFIASQKAKEQYKDYGQQCAALAQARLGMQDGLAMALSVVELYGMKGDVIYREIAKLRDGIAAAPAPQPAQEPRHTIPR